MNKEETAKTAAVTDCNTPETQEPGKPEAEKPGVARRTVLKAGAVGAVAGMAWMVGQKAEAAEGPPEGEPGTPQLQKREPVPESKLKSYLRDTSKMEWRKKLHPDSPMYTEFEHIMRIDPEKPLPPGLPNKDYKPVITPDNFTLPFKIDNGVKVFHLVATEVLHKFANGCEAFTYGYNGHVPGPTIEAVEGDRVRFYVTNMTPVPTSVHWHGFVIPPGMDGVSGLTNPATMPGETSKYEFTILQNGTFMYHSHHDTFTQEAIGLSGMFIVHPRRELYPPDSQLIDGEVDRDFVILLQEWRVEPGSKRVFPLTKGGWNLFTMNARVFPDTEFLICRLGQTIRIRFGNLSVVHNHPIHIHGGEFLLTGEDAYHLPPGKQRLQATFLVPIGRTRNVEWLALWEDDWIFHCHMLPHIVNQWQGYPFSMHGVETETLDPEVRKVLPNYKTLLVGGENDRLERPDYPTPTNMIPFKMGRGPWGMIPFGGMTKIIKVRKNISDADLARNADPGWYVAKPEYTALPVSPEELKRAGIKTPTRSDFNLAPEPKGGPND